MFDPFLFLAELVLMARDAVAGLYRFLKRDIDEFLNDPFSEPLYRYCFMLAATYLALRCWFKP